MAPFLGKVLFFENLESNDQGQRGYAMAKQSDGQIVICAKLRELGYATERHIRLYGEEFRLVSDPIPDGDGFAVEGIARRSGKPRYIRIPLSIVHTLRQEFTFNRQPDIAA
jgi:hypothetical protein